MGIYLNPGTEKFKEALDAEIYVDKTMMIRKINEFISTGNNRICVSCPHGFGKTITANMLTAYYSKGCESEKLFSSLKISSAEGFNEQLNHYNVIKIDLAQEFNNTTDGETMILDLEDRIKEELGVFFPDIRVRDNESLANTILKIYSETRETFVFIIDNYDILVRGESPQDQIDRYLDFLSGLFKSDMLAPAIRLEYLTGVLPMVRDTHMTRLSNIRGYSMIDPLNLVEYVGLTSEEVQKLCKEYNVNYEDCRNWYGGYMQHGLEIFSPLEVVNAIKNNKFESTGKEADVLNTAFKYTSVDPDMIRESIKELLGGKNMDVDVYSYLNTMKSFRTKDAVLTYLLHEGCLAYDLDKKTCYIPNETARRQLASFAN